MFSLSLLNAGFERKGGRENPELSEAISSLFCTRNCREKELEDSEPSEAISLLFSVKNYQESLGGSILSCQK